MGERIMAVPASCLDELDHYPIGFKVDPQDKVIGHLLSNADFYDRDPLETDERYKQIIPYIMFAAIGEDEAYLFNYRRTTKGGEARLHELRSLGIGGHINTDDRSEHNPKCNWITFMRGMLREIEEEVSLNMPILSHAVLGVVNREDSPVARVHIGIVSVVMCRMQGSINRRCDSLSQGQFHKTSVLAKEKEEFEPWSQSILDTAILASNF